MVGRWLNASLITLGVAMAAATPAWAQGEVVTGEKGAGKVTVFGHTELTWVGRDAVFEAVFPRRGPFPIKPNDEIFGDFRVKVGIDATLEKKFGGKLVLMTGADTYGGENHRMGDDFNNLVVDQAYLYARDAFELFDARLGVQNVKLTFRDKRGHGAFFLDISHSEDPFSGAAHTSAFTGGAPTGVNVSQSGVGNPLAAGGGVPFSSAYPLPVSPDATVSLTGYNPYLGGNAWVSNLAGQSKRSEFGGLTLDLTGLEHLDLLVFAGTTMESGTANADTNVIGVSATARFQLPASAQDSLLRLTFATFDSGGPVAVHSAGVAIDLWTAGDRLEAYGEFVGQAGVYTDGPRAGARDHTPQKSWAWYAGGRIEVPFTDLGIGSANTSGQNLFVDASYWHLSGDDGNPNQANEDYVSFENVDSGLLLEGAQYGFDIDTNYYAIKVEAGVNLEWMTLSVFWGDYYLNQAPMGNVGSSANIRQHLGNEYDIRLRIINWPVPNLEVGFATGLLFGSDFFAGLVRERNSLDPTLPQSGSSLHRAQLWMFTVKVSF